MRKYIQCQLRVEGLHCWKDCNIDEVKYLKNFHRHEFVIEVTKKVEGSDRDIEFIQFKHQILKYFHQHFWSTAEQCHVFDHMSCEHIAEMLIEQFKLYSCSVKEDGENGALIIEEKYA